MTDWDLPRSPASALLLTRLGAEHGIPAQACLRGTRLALDALADPRIQVTADQELRIVRNLLRAVPDAPALGLQAGTRYHLTTHGIWGFALASSSTLRSAIAIGLRYLHLTFAFCRMSTTEGTEGLRLVLDGSHLPSDVRRFFVERELASIVTLGRELGAAPSMVAGVHLRHHEPASTDLHVEVFGIRPVFGAEANFLAVDPALLDRPLPQADAHTAALAEAQCRELLDRWRARAGVAGKVRDRLVARPRTMPDIEEVAAGLHMSSRTLRRQLEAEGTSYRALADEVREHLAEELLATGGLTVEEIGRRLGYAATPSFTNAFKRWKGVPPRAYLAR